MTYDSETEECEYADGKLTVTSDGITMILNQEKEELALSFSFDK